MNHYMHQNHNTRFTNQNQIFKYLLFLLIRDNYTTRRKKFIQIRRSSSIMTPSSLIYPALSYLILSDHVLSSPPLSPYSSHNKPHPPTSPFPRMPTLLTSIPQQSSSLPNFFITPTSTPLLSLHCISSRQLVPSPTSLIHTFSPFSSTTSSPPSLTPLTTLHLLLFFPVSPISLLSIHLLLISSLPPTSTFSRMPFPLPSLPQQS